MIKYSAARKKILSWILLKLRLFKYEIAHDKTYKKTCVNSKDSVQPDHPPSKARALAYPSFDSLEAVEGTCD